MARHDVYKKARDGGFPRATHWPSFNNHELALVDDDIWHKDED